MKKLDQKLTCSTAACSCTSPECLEAEVGIERQCCVKLPNKAYGLLPDYWICLVLTLLAFFFGHFVSGVTELTYIDLKTLIPFQVWEGFRIRNHLIKTFQKRICCSFMESLSEV